MKTIDELLSRKREVEAELASAAPGGWSAKVSKKQLQIIEKQIADLHQS